MFNRASYLRFVSVACLASMLAAPFASFSDAADGRPLNQPPGVVAKINEEIRKQWNEHGVSRSKAATDGEWVRRLYLDLIGRIPSVNELNEFHLDSGSKKRARLVKTLLYDDRYSAQFADNWSSIWTNLLIGRSGGTERNTLTNREGMKKYLRDAFARNTGYDKMVLDLVTAEGNSKPGLKEFNGAVNFLSMKLGEKGTQATADTARIFLGKQVQCTQCHNHPFNDWKQDQFWQLNSFFRQTVSLRRFNQTDRMVQHVLLTDQDYAGEGGDPAEAEVYFESRDGTLQAAYPVFISGQELANRSGRVEEVHRRKALADFIVESKEMPRAIVNRTWAHFLNQGFTTPVDDMGPHNPPTHPELLDYLAEQFTVNSFDLRLLMEWIVLSEPYSLSSRMTKRNKVDDPSTGEKPLFTHYYIRQMRAEQLFDSLITATRADRTTNADEQQQMRRRWLSQFVIAFGNDEGTESTTFDGTITQALVLFNGSLMKKALDDSDGSLLKTLGNRKDKSYQEKVNALTLASFSRRASRQEQKIAHQLLRLNNKNEFNALQDLWWAMLNSNEFILNH